MKLKTLLLAILIMPAVCFADISIIVHPNNQVIFDEDNIKRIFLGKTKKFNTDEQALPLTTEKSSTEYMSFTESFLSRSASQYDAYWAKLAFTGRGTPPSSVASDKMLDMVSKNENAIGFIDSSKVDNTVRVLHTF